MLAFWNNQSSGLLICAADITDITQWWPGDGKIDYKCWNNSKGQAASVDRVGQTAFWVGNSLPFEMGMETESDMAVRLNEFQKGFSCHCTMTLSLSKTLIPLHHGVIEAGQMMEVHGKMWITSTTLPS